jgi:WhiB family redox-sensing transcriptional regulator
VTDEAWMSQAACDGVDASLFFPERGENNDNSGAKAVCRECPVREDCLEYALANGIRYGIWGGTSEGERKRIRRIRARLAEAS